MTKGTAAPLLAGMASGFVGGFMGSALNGQSFGDSMKAGLIGGFAGLVLGGGAGSLNGIYAGIYSGAAIFGGGAMAYGKGGEEGLANYGFGFMAGVLGGMAGNYLGSEIELQAEQSDFQETLREFEMLRAEFERDRYAYWAEIGGSLDGEYVAHGPVIVRILKNGIKNTPRTKLPKNFNRPHHNYKTTDKPSPRMDKLLEQTRPYEKGWWGKFKQWIRNMHDSRRGGGDSPYDGSTPLESVNPPAPDIIFKDCEYTYDLMI